MYIQEFGIQALLSLLREQSPRPIASGRQGTWTALPLAQQLVVNWPVAYLSRLAQRRNSVYFDGEADGNSRVAGALRVSENATGTWPLLMPVRGANFQLLADYNVLAEYSPRQSRSPCLAVVVQCHTPNVVENRRKPELLRNLTDAPWPSASTDGMPASFALIR